MDRITTSDGSITFHNKEFDETYHSVSGAEEEALKKYILPSLKKTDLSKMDKIRILDVCFGLGYNSAAAIDEIRKISPKVRIEIIGLEIDKDILDKISGLDTNFESYPIIKACVKNYYRYEDNNIKVEIITGDAMEKIDTLKGGFDFIFHDPFSTKKMPLFWSEEFFRKIARLCHEGSILTTYSCSKAVRQNLMNAGFRVEDVAPVGRKAPSTLAVKLHD